MHHIAIPSSIGCVQGLVAFNAVMFLRLLHSLGHDDSKTFLLLSATEKMSDNWWVDSMVFEAYNFLGDLLIKLCADSV